MHPGATAQYREDDSLRGQAGFLRLPGAAGRKGAAAAVSAQPSLQTHLLRLTVPKDCPLGPTFSGFQVPWSCTDLVHSNSALDVSVLALCSRVLPRDALFVRWALGARRLWGRGRQQPHLRRTRCSAVSPACRTTTRSAREPPAVTGAAQDLTSPS